MHEGLNSAGCRRLRLQRFRGIAIERRGVIERHSNLGLITFRANERVDQGAQPFKWLFLDVLEDDLGLPFDCSERYLRSFYRRFLSLGPYRGFGHDAPAGFLMARDIVAVSSRATA
jgi:hypothetical protein